MFENFSEMQISRFSIGKKSNFEENLCSMF
jgi:hypothetical protein